MKKTLLSVLAGLTVVGSAVALPTPEDRKKLCDQNPDKYVWVEKTKACIPINPCSYDNADIKKAYCNEHLRILPNDASKRDLLINRYVERVLGTSVKEIKEVGAWEDYLFVVGVKTDDDDGYFAMPYYANPGDETAGDYVTSAFIIYGYDSIYHTKSTEEIKDGWIELIGTPELRHDDPICQDIKDFASLVAGELLEQNGSDECYIKVKRLSDW